MVGNILTPTHLLLVLVVALLVLGPKRLPSAGRGLGEAMRGFKDALAPGNGADTTGPQIPEDRRIMEAIDAAAAGTASWQSPSPGSTSSAPQTPNTQEGPSER